MSLLLYSMEEVFSSLELRWTTERHFRAISQPSPAVSYPTLILILLCIFYIFPLYLLFLQQCFTSTLLLQLGNFQPTSLVVVLLKVSYLAFYSAKVSTFSF